MILSDVDISRRLANGDLVVTPLGNKDVQIQPASIDLRLGNTFLTYHPQTTCLDPHDPATQRAESHTVASGEAFILQPGEFALATTIEYVKIPHDLVARVEGRSSLGRLAVIVHATAGFVDPGFEGQITLELSNLGRIPVKLYPGDRVCQIVLHQLTGPAQRPYGIGRGSKYSGQMGPTPSRIAEDKEH